MIRTTAPLGRHHHFRSDLIDPADTVSRLEARVVAELLGSRVGDDQRDSSIAFELKHSAAVVQFARLLAYGRGLPQAVCAAGALLHDIFVIVTGSYDNHAISGGPIAEDWISDVGGFSAAETRQALEIVTYHSEKHVWTSEPFIEFGKDVDVLDCFLYPDALDEYLLAKPLAIAQQYLRRAQLVWEELGLPRNHQFEVLNGYREDGWLNQSAMWSRAQLAAFLSDATERTAPFVIVPIDTDNVTVHFEETPPNRPDASLVGDRPHLLTTVDVATAVWPAIGKHEVLDANRAQSFGIECSADELVTKHG